MAKITVAGRQVEVSETAVDRAIAYFAPIHAARRLYARGAMALAGGYSGGRRDKRSTSAWQPKGNSADADLLPDLPTLRERSRDLVRNAPLAAGALNTVATNVVGTGLLLKSRPHREVLGWTEKQAAEWRQATEREWRLWADSSDCDITRAQDFYGLQDLVLRSHMENGDVLTLLPFVNRRGRVYQLAVQLIEADRLCNKDSAADTPTLAGGVRMDGAGAPVAYQVLNSHPGDRTVVKREWTEYAAFGASTGRRNVLHHYSKRRIGQTRGAPYFAPVIEAFKSIDRYTEAEIFAAVASAMFAIVTKTEDRSGLGPLESAVTGVTPTSGTSDTAKGSDWDGTITPGLTIDLGKDESVEAFKSEGRPNPQFDPFVQAILRQVGVALELPFEVLIKHFTASYSAARSSLLEAWKFYRVRRAWLAGSFCQPVYEAWMEEAVALGRIDAPGFFDDPLLRRAYCGAVWHGDGPGSIDPMKEASAVEKRLSINLRTLEQEIAEDSGGDVGEVLEQRGRERAMAKQFGAEEPAPAPAAPAPADGTAAEVDPIEAATVGLATELAGTVMASLKADTAAKD